MPNEFESTAQGGAPLAVGVDIVLQGRIASTIDQFGDRFERRVFTPRELDALSALVGTRHLDVCAALWAGKEAVIKALRPSAYVDLREIELLGDPVDLSVHLDGYARQRATECGLVGMKVSVIKVGMYSLAVAFAKSASHSSSGDRDQRLQLPPRIEPLAVDRAPDALARLVTGAGAMRNRPCLTETVAHSVAAWQATTRALHLYMTLRRIEAPLVDLLCLYTSVINRCVYCIDDAAGEALDHGWTTGELLAVARGDLSGFSREVRAALRYAEAVALRPTAIDDGVFDDLRAHYDDEQILEIAAVTAMKNFWNRLASSLRIPVEGRCADHDFLVMLVATRDEELGDVGISR